MNWKAMIKSKTFWASIGTIVSAIGVIVQTGDTQTALPMITTALIAIFLRDGIAKGGK